MREIALRVGMEVILDSLRIDTNHTIRIKAVSQPV